MSAPRTGGAFRAATAAAALVGSGAMLLIVSNGAPADGLSLAMGLIFALAMLPFAFAVAGVHTLLFALPVYLWIGRFATVTRGRAIAAGILIGMVPIGAAALATARVQVDELLLALWPFGVAGAAGGLAFHHNLGREPVEQPE